MYSTINQGFRDGSLTQDDLNLWYHHWMVNIAGFRGHLAPVGSLYLGQRTYMAMNQVMLALGKMLKDSKVNPMALYLQKRANWLHLSKWTKKPHERVALASLAASLRLFTVQDGKMLYQSFHSLSALDQRRWLTHVERQQTILNEPASTHAPALLANAVAIAKLPTTVVKVLPVMMDSFELAHNLRMAGVLKNNIPLSFRELARKETVSRILSSKKPLAVDIDPANGIAILR